VERWLAESEVLAWNIPGGTVQQRHACLDSWIRHRDLSSEPPRYEAAVYRNTQSCGKHLGDECVLRLVNGAPCTTVLLWAWWAGLGRLSRALEVTVSPPGGKSISDFFRRFYQCSRKGPLCHFVCTPYIIHPDIPQM
jgi:hypothetical protein